MRKKGIAVLIAALMIVIMACGTSVAIRVTKPAEVNMSGARKIAVFDFTYPQEYPSFTEDDILDYIIAEALNLDMDVDTMEREVAEYTARSLVTALVKTDYFEVLSPTDVTQAMIGANNPNLGLTDVGLLLGADAILVGSIDYMRKDERYFMNTVWVYDPATETTVETELPWVEREIEISVTYRVLDASTGKLYATKSINEARIDDAKEEDNDTLRSYESMFKSVIDNLVPRVAKQLAPYTVTEYRWLEKDKTKDPRMEQADEFVKGGIYQKALEIFLSIWNANSNMAAGYNAAIMYEATGNIDAAIELMDQVMNMYPERKIMREYNRLLADKEEMERVAEQMN